MKKIAILFAFVAVVFLALLLLSSTAPAVNAQPQNPSDRSSQGLVYEGLVGNDPDCKSGFKISKKSGAKNACSPGPDRTPSGFDVKKPVSPAATAEARRAPSGSPTTSTPSILCDGDGTSGNRVQVLYAHASDVADRYSSYQASFKTWTIGMDAIFNNSAAQTGGTRHIRFVHDPRCNPIIPNVMLSTSGDDNFANTINELEMMGYNRVDRKYIVFMDARVYCGIATMSFDDWPGPSNANNIGDSFGRIDAGCWSDVIPAHELMHQFGGVQLSAPHSSGDSHCYDGYDDMCRPTNGTPLRIACSDIAQGSLLDCGHEDYYNTNPAAGSYLATHWNSANCAFLILPVPKGSRR